MRFVGLLIGQNPYKFENLAVAGLAVAAAKPIATIPKKITGNYCVNMGKGVQERPSKVYKN